MPSWTRKLGAYFHAGECRGSVGAVGHLDPTDILLDPSSSDARFIARHPNSVGVERNAASAAEAAGRAPSATVVEGDLFTGAPDDSRQFDSAVGHPSFIRHRVSPGQRDRPRLTTVTTRVLPIVGWRLRGRLPRRRGQQAAPGPVRGDCDRPWLPRALDARANSSTTSPTQAVCWVSTDSSTPFPAGTKADRLRRAGPMDSNAQAAMATYVGGFRDGGDGRARSCAAGLFLTSAQAPGLSQVTEAEQMAKHRGTFEELQAWVRGMGYEGTWTSSENKRVFRSKDGAILNWWPSTQRLQCQGPKGPKAALDAAVSETFAGEERAPSPAPKVPIASDLASQATVAGSKRVFVVHGHDDSAREQTELVLRRLNLQPFVLANTSGGGLTIIEALETEIDSTARGSRFGIVLLTPDDMGYKSGKDATAAEPRARQNVVMEMGMLIAAFGRRRVAVLKKGHVVVPSDAAGLLYLGFNAHVRETVPKLCDRLREAGFDLGPEAITSASS